MRSFEEARGEGAKVIGCGGEPFDSRGCGTVWLGPVSSGASTNPKGVGCGLVLGTVPECRQWWWVGPHPE
jgi:hypothetical protein